MSIRDDVLKCVDKQWRSYRNVHKRLGLWSQDTVRIQLMNLRKEGKVQRRLVPAGSRFQSSEYRLPDDQLPSEAARPATD